ncbi:lysophospholipid acyltransferase family protein [Pelagibacteraceae bacterium]|nr:lysophospholipid acyltransferase family protein [Pelagibacteraceae bacterium]
MKKKILYFLQSIIVYLFFLISKTIGLNLSRKLFSLIFKKAGNLFKSKKIVYKNLDMIKPNLDILAKERLINKMWSNYGKTFIEYVHLNLFRKKSSHILIKNKKVIDEIVKKNKPVIFVSGHFANYELMSMELTKSNVKLATIYRPLNNIFLNPFMEFLRKTYVCKDQIKKGLKGVKQALDYMKKDYSIALMVDQRVSEGSKVKFFNNYAYTTTLPAQLSSRFDCDIVPIYISRTLDDTFEMEILNPVQISNSEKKNKELITKKVNEIIEKLILKDPSQWILTHNRWK